jgi:hypothetical protein
MALRVRRRDPVRELVAALEDPRARPDERWLAALSRAPPERLREVLAELPGLLPVEEAIGRTLRAGGRTMYAQINAPLELYALTRLLQPEHIVETGVSSGISSAHYLLALQRNGHGHLHSIDLPTFQRGPEKASDESPVSIPPGRSSGWAVPPELRVGWDLRIGPTQELLGPLLKELSQVQIFLHDDLHTEEHLRWELDLVRPHLAPGALVLADNTKWTGRAFPDFARQYGTRPLRKRGHDLMGIRLPAPDRVPGPVPHAVARARGHAARRAVGAG